MRYAIVESGGKQYRAVEGRTIEVDRLPIEVGNKFDFERVLLMADGDEILVGGRSYQGSQDRPFQISPEEAHSSARWASSAIYQLDGGFHRQAW
jgi:hypothetical protein